MPPNKLTPIQELDNVLLALADNSDHFYKSFADISQQVKDRSLSDTHLILNKLIRDGYAEKKIGHETSENPTERMYCITFDGELFIAEKGYRQREMDRILARESSLTKNRQDRINQTLLTFGSLAAAIGAISLTLWELYKYYHLHLK